MELCRPKETVDVFKKYIENKEILIFDGMWNWFSRLELKKFGFKYFHGADLSQKLLDTVPEDPIKN